MLLLHTPTIGWCSSTADVISVHHPMLAASSELRTIVVARACILASTVPTFSLVGEKVCHLS
jgi:hypothetical protein